ncbi:MAG TPA: FixH family protein [Xanthobacteraceae bacterium]|nr:FixH family protein [Xanthobacteraceae bacterium]
MSMQFFGKRTDKRSKEITGRTVLVCLVVFFAIVVAVNLVLVRAAISTFGGLETESSYRAGLAFGGEIAVAHAQQARHWHVTAQFLPSKDGPTAIEIIAQDATGQPLTGLGATVRLEHPTDKRLDHTLVMSEVSSGRFRGTTTSSKGEWDLLIELSRGDERLFRSKNRVSLH